MIKGIIRIDSKGAILFASAEALSMFGYPKEKFIGANLSLFVKGEEEKNILKGKISSLADGNLEKENNTVRTQAVAESGETIPIELTFSEFIIEDRQYPFLIVRDISSAIKREEARIESEERFRKLSQASFEGIFITQNGKVLDCNEAFATIFGYKIPEVVGKDILELIAHKDKEKVRANVFSRYEKEYEADGLRKNGGEIKLQIHGRETLYHGKPARISALRDITKQKLAEEKLVAAKETAEEATMLKDKFVSLVSHDLKGPLAAILGFLKIALNHKKLELTNDELEEMLKSAQNSGNKMVKLIDELLSLSRIKSGKIAPQMKFFDPYFIGTRLSLEMEYASRRKGVSLINDILPGSRVFADEQLLLEVIANLMANAIKFTKSGDSVKLYISKEDPSTIVIEDTGSGIAPNIIEKIFKYEEKTTTSGTSGETGTGLGLPLSYDIMKAHGGELRVESEQNKGTRFFVSLPDVSPKALIVDDCEADRIILKHTLKAARLQLFEAENGIEALKILEKENIQLVITDIHMPEMNGFELLEKMRSNPNTDKIPALVITSDSEIETREKATRLGAVDFCTKPLSHTDFIPRVNKFVGV